MRKEKEGRFYFTQVKQGGTGPGDATGGTGKKALAAMLALIAVAAICVLYIIHNAKDVDAILLTGQPYEVSGLILRHEGMDKDGKEVSSSSTGQMEVDALEGMQLYRYCFKVYDVPGLEESSYSVQIGDSFTLPVPDGVPVTYASSDSSAVAISGEGVVSITKAGSYTITREVNSYYKDGVTVEVAEPQVTTREFVMYPGEKETLDVENIDPSLLKWKSSDARVAKVKKQKIKAKKPGRAELTASIGGKTYTVSVKVSEELTVSEPADMKLGTKRQLEVSNAVGTVTYSSSSKGIVSVGKKGVLKAKSPGTAVITVKARTQVKEVPVTVQSPYFASESISLEEGEKTENILKNYGGNVSYESSGTSVATVSDSGTVTAVAAGTCTVTATTEEGYKISYPVKVTAKPQETATSAVSLSGSTSSAKKLLEACAYVAQYANDNGWAYSNSGVGNTFSLSKTKKRTNCAHFVSLCLQQAGAIPEGMAIWSNKSGEMNWNTARRAAVEAVATICSYENGIKVKDAGLQPGDILGYKGHMNIYAGKNSDGVRTWYDFGRDGTYGHRAGSKFNRVLCTRDYGDEKIYTLIRLK